jgi:FkbM family methyltransferase
VFSCGIHGECTEARVAEGVACCATCDHFRPRDTSPAAAHAPENSVEAMTALLREPRRTWPDDWPYWGTTLEAHRALAAEFEKQLPPYPEGKYRGRGIVILGGGPFFPGVYVSVRMIRHFGCELPIEVWHHADTEPVEEAWLRPLGARCFDLDRHHDPVMSPRLRGGWLSKFYAVLHASFEEALYLDSDCYPVADVTTLFDHNPHGALFWPNLPHSDKLIHWQIYGTQPGHRPPIQGGQFLMHKGKCWQALVLAQWWNERADYSYRHGYGDEDILRGVWQQQGKEFAMFHERPQWDRVAYIFAGPEGQRPVLVHRCHDKFRLPALELRCQVSGAEQFYKQWSTTAETTYQPGLPGEDLAFAFFQEFKQRFDHDPARFRTDTNDHIFWEEIVTRNRYRLPEQLPAESLILDVGAHIGAFTHLALRRGAARVWAFEPDADNWAKCIENLVLWGDRVTLLRQAVWSERGRAGFLPSPGDRATGRVLPAGDAVETVAIDVILDEVSDNGSHPIYLLKLACEGSEWPILFAARRLALCENIVGEYHAVEWEGKRRGPDDLCRVLRRHGFEVRTSPVSDSRGLFWATRSNSLAPVP